MYEMLELLIPTTMYNCVCRRLLQVVVDRHTRTKWVKVKGHSEHEGNDRADDCATWGQNGGAKGEQDMESMMGYIREHG